MKRWLRWIAAAGVVAALLGNSGGRRLFRNAMELRKSGEKLAQLKNEEATLRKEQNDLKNDDRKLETVARRELGLLKPGEVEYRFKDEEKK